MSSLKPPINKDELDQAKGYHIVPSDDNWSQGVVCGELSKTGKTSHYGYFSCHELICKKCNKKVDIGYYDLVYIGKNSNLGESW